jgi:hypothetical protein
MLVFQAAADFGGLNEPGGDVHEATKRAAERVAQRTRSNIMSQDLVKTGRMLDSVRSEMRKGIAGPEGWVVVNTEYARYLDGGTRYIRARRFLSDAIAGVSVADFL